MSLSYLHQDILQLKVTCQHPTHEPVLPSPGYSTAEGLDVNIQPMSLSYLHQDILQLKVSMSLHTHERPVYLQPGYSTAEDILQLKVSRIFLQLRSPMSTSTMSPVLPSPDIPPAEGLHVNIQPMSPSYLHQDILQLKVSMSTSDP
eukprot:gene13765-19669_t